MVFEILLDVRGDGATLLIPSAKDGSPARMVYTVFDRDNNNPLIPGSFGPDGINETPATSSTFHV